MPGAILFTNIITEWDKMSINTSFGRYEPYAENSLHHDKRPAIRQRARLLTWYNCSYNTNRLVPGVGKLSLGCLWNNQVLSKETCRYQTCKYLDGLAVYLVAPPGIVLKHANTHNHV